MRKLAATITAVAGLVLAAPASARVLLYGSPGPEQAQLQAWIDTSHARTPNVPVRLYEGNCEEGRPEGKPSEHQEEPGGEASLIQTCAAFTPSGGYAVYVGHMAWHPQYPEWWWHLNLLNELGHTYDEVVGGRDQHRRAFSAIYGYNSRWWWPINTSAALNTEWEKWSMGYAFCGYGMSYEEAHGLIDSGEYAGFGFNPSAVEYRRTCRLMDHLPGRTGRLAGG